MRLRVGLLLLFAVAIAGAFHFMPANWRHVQGWIPFAVGSHSDADSTPRYPTFNRDIAPVVFAHCAGCHHPGGVGPFDLLTIANLRKHSKEVADLTSRRRMPPWMPDDNCGPFEGERRLSAGQIALFQRWVGDGMPEGNPADLPAAPVYHTDWELGEPDLVVKLPSPFTLPAEGKDIYQNFVLPAGLDAPRTVRAVELRSGNTRVVHHASLLIDSTGAAKIRARKNGGDGYPGMDPGEGVSGVAGRFLFWQPGTSFCIKTEVDPWRLPAGADVLLQMHLRPTGKPEVIQPEVGFYFTNQPPAKLLFKLMLRSTAIDIAPGNTDYSISSSYVLPVDAQVLAVSEHAHYLGKDLQGYATLPDGTRRTLLRIANWDFFWQGSYRFVTPVNLPKGTVLQMHFTYDNSEQNSNNPSHPPRRVVYGLNSDDEMGEFWAVLKVRNEEDFQTLTADYLNRVARPDTIAQLRTQLLLKPDDADLHAALAVSLLDSGEQRDGTLELQTALRLNEACGKAHRCLANILLSQGDAAQAVEQFRKAVAADPADFSSQADLGLALASSGKIPEGIEQLKSAIALNPRDALTHTNLARVYLVNHQEEAARTELQRALQLDPDLPLANETNRIIGRLP